MSAELLIRGARALSGESLDVLISDGVVASCGPALDLEAGSEIDATGLTILPGCVDPHVHFNEPGFRSEWEGWATGSAAAATGGLTTVVEMPLNANPPTVNVDAFDLKAAVAGEKSRVDFALWGGVVPGNLDQLEPLAQRGVIGFKAFMAASGVDDFEAVDDLTLYEAMQRIAALGLPLSVHAESTNITLELASRARAEGRVSMRDYLDSRPAVAETQAIARAIELASVTGCSLHVVHVSSARGAELVAAARASGIDVTCEFTAHNLILTDEDAVRLGAIAKCAPPLRTESEAERLWELLGSGVAEYVVSDHSPSSPELKRGEDMFAAWGGISGVQTLVEAVLTEGQPRLSAQRLQEALTSGAAKRLRLRGKGSLAVGSDADVTLLALGTERQLEARELHYRHPYSAWVGRRLGARVIATILRGEAIYRDGRLTGPPRGRLIRPLEAT